MTNALILRRRNHAYGERGTFANMLCDYCHLDAMVRFEEDDIFEVDVAPVYAESLNLCVLHAAQFEEWQAHAAPGGTGPTPFSAVVWPPGPRVAHPLRTAHYERNRIRYAPRPCSHCNRRASHPTADGWRCSVHVDADVRALPRLR